MAPQPQPQNVFGLIYSGAESGFYSPALVSRVADFATVGLANFGTRLRARIDRSHPGRASSSAHSGWLLRITWRRSHPNGSIARLIADESSAFSAAPPSTTLDGIPAAELTVANGSASAVWEVLRGNPAAQENFDFLYWVQTGPGLGHPGVTVTASFAP